MEISYIIAAVNIFVYETFLLMWRSFFFLESNCMYFIVLLLIKFNLLYNF